MANTVTLPPAAGRSSYDFLTVRNASTTEHLEVYTDGTDSFLDNPDPTLTYLIVPPSDALTLQSNGLNAWASMSSATQNAMVYRHAWNSSLVYYRGNVVYDGRWTMIANKQTQDRPAPQLAGTPEWLLPDTPGAESTRVDSAIYTGNEFTFLSAHFVTAVRVWVAPSSVGYQHRVVLEDHTDPTNIRRDIGSIFTPDTSGWIELPQGQTPIISGSIIRVGLYVIGQATPTQFSGTWQYKRSDGESSEGEIWQNTSGRMRINNVDKDGADRTTELANMSVGDTISGGGVNWVITNVNDHNATELDVQVDPTTRAQEDEYTFTFTYYGDATLGYMEEANYWSPQPHPQFTGRGFTQWSDAALAFNDNGYGCDINVSDAVVSPDWDYLSSDSL